MATEKAKGWQTQAATIAPLRQAWRDLAVHQWLLQANARLEIQSALASRVQDYFGQLQKRIVDRQAAIRDQLEAHGTPPGNTQHPGRLQSIVSSIVTDLTSKEMPVSAQTVNAALIDLGLPAQPANVVRGLITHHLLSGQ
jgi:hypothetical protein